MGEEFVRAVDLILECRGRVVVVGMGKSGLVGRKIASTLNSTGTPAFFLHAAEGLHGDLGMVVRGDVAFLLSKSGETEELCQLLNLFRRLKVPTIGLLGSLDSTLGRACDVALDVSVKEEACPHDLAPTASTTAALALGDALAMALLMERGFGPADFAILHPGGVLGKRLLLKVEDVMLTGNDVPSVSFETTMREAVLEMMAKRGITAVVDGDRSVVGVVTNGDLVRLMRTTDQIFGVPVREVMNPRPKTVRPETLAVTALNRMETFGIMAMPVVDGKGSLVGIVHLHDLMRAGVV